MLVAQQLVISKGALARRIAVSAGCMAYWALAFGSPAPPAAWTTRIADREMTAPVRGAGVQNSIPIRARGLRSLHYSAISARLQSTGAGHPLIASALSADE